MHAGSCPDSTQGALLERLAREHGGREALVMPGRGLRWSFADLERRSLAIARGLLALGVERGERVAVWSDNRPDWVALQFAVARVGAVLVTANTALTRAEIRYLLEQSRCAAVVAAPGIAGREYVEALETLRATPGALPELRHALVLEAEPPPGMLAFEELVSAGAEVPAEAVHERSAAARPDDPANIQYTSGTTGFPKGVVLSHTNLIQNAWAVSRRMAVDEHDRLLLMVPLFHCFGCVVCVLGAATHAIPLVAIERFDPWRALEAAALERCTLLYGVPAMFRAMLEHPRRAELELGTLRAGIMGGAACPEALVRRVSIELGCTGVLAAYGLTEASPAVTMSAPSDPLERRAGSVGTALPGVSVRIVEHASGRELPRGAAGELWARGPNVMRGYFEDPAGSATALTPDGWLRTGDLATMDEAGVVRIVGRIKEMIIRGGENVSPAEVEDALRAHPGVVDAAVFGVPSEEWGEEVAAAVIRRGSAPSAAELALFLEDRLARFKRPSRIHFVERFPTTSSGKLQRSRLAEELAGA